MKNLEDVIMGLKKDPTKEYISRAHDLELLELTARVKRKPYTSIKYIEFVNERGEAVDSIGLNRKWREIKKPVDFMTAVKSGKNISVKCAIETYEGKGKLRQIYYRSLNEMLRTLAGYGDVIAIDIILNGDWYIED